MTKSLLHSIGTAAFVMGCVLAIPAVAAAQTPSKPASITGTWNMGLIGDHVIPTALVVEQTGTKLKATYIFMGKEFPFTGEVTGATFTLTGQSPLLGSRPAEHGAAAPASKPAPNGPPAGFNVNTAPVVDTTIVGTINDDGTLAGDMNVKMDETRKGRIKWTAERLKARPVASTSAPAASVDLNGDWKMMLNEAQVHVDVTFKVAEGKITGTGNSDHLGVLKIDGTYANGVMAFTAKGSANGQPVDLEYTGKAKADGSIGGDVKTAMGAMTWTAERVKK